MQPVKLNRYILIDTVKFNKEKHIKDYAESVEDYKAAIVELCSTNLKLAKTGDPEKIAKIRSMPTSPTSYEESYTRAIRMFEMSVDDIIELEEDDFNQLVLDEWSWKRSFTQSSVLYKSMSSR